MNALVKATQEDVFFETVLAADALAKAYLSFLPSTKPKKSKEPDVIFEARKKMILDALKSNKEDFSDAKTIISKMVSAMDRITYDVTSDPTDLVSIQKKVKELDSILHIGRSYPDNAVKRARNIKKTWGVL